eukprot:13770553-Alexandrium_andersonii.AAC.1
MPRTPAVFERRVRWRKYDDPLENGPPEDRGNYTSVGDRVDDIEELFQAEASEGMMRCVPDQEAIEEYGDGLVTAALGALQKDDSSFRVIHDATHGVEVNQRIAPRDQA